MIPRNRKISEHLNFVGFLPKMAAVSYPPRSFKRVRALSLDNCE